MICHLMLKFYRPCQSTLFMNEKKNSALRSGAGGVAQVNRSFLFPTQKPFVLTWVHLRVCTKVSMKEF